MPGPATVVVTDLDGTFWGHDLTCHPTTHDALAELDARGVGVLVATGRRAASARRGLDGNGLRLPSVLLNGALGVDFRSDTTFHEHPYSPEDVVRVLDVFDRHGLAPCVYTTDGMVQSTHAPTTARGHVANLGEELHRHDDLLAAVAGHAVLGMSILGRPFEQLANAVEALHDLGHGDIAFYQDALYEGWSLMVQPGGITKWNGIRAWFAHAGWAPERVIAIGDGGNDVEMLRCADLAVAVEGGDPEALAAADVVIDHPTSGGWCSVLDLL